MSEAPNLFDAGSLEEAAGSLLAGMYARRGRALYGLCRMMLRDPHEAEDALQSTFLSAHRSLLSGNAPRDEGAWLATIARNECRGRIRERMRAPVTAEAAVLEGVADTARTPEELLADDGIGKALAALPESQREAVVLHDVFGLRSREVGVALGLSVPAVEAVLFRARRQLRTRLRPVGASALSLPLGVQEALSLQIPGFAAGGAGAGTVAVGAGLLAKVVGTPTVLKVAAGAAALATAGSVAVVGQHRDPNLSRQPTELGSAIAGDASTAAASRPIAEADAQAARSQRSTVSPREPVASGRSAGSKRGGWDSADPEPETPAGDSGADDGGAPSASGTEVDDGLGDDPVSGKAPGEATTDGDGGSDKGATTQDGGAATDDGNDGGAATEVGSSGPGSGSGSSERGGDDFATSDSSGKGGSLSQSTETEAQDGGGEGMSGEDAELEDPSGAAGGSGTSNEPVTESGSGSGSSGGGSVSGNSGSGGGTDD